MTSSSLLATSRKIGSKCILGSWLEINSRFFTMYPLVPKAMSTPVAGRTPHVAVLFLYLGKIAFVLQIAAKMLPQNWIRVPLILGYPGARRVPQGAAQPPPG